MITAAEALALPRARLSPSDAEAAERFLADLEAYVREHMTRIVCVMPVDPSRMNPVIAAEVERACRRAGWRAQFQEAAVPSALSPGQKIARYQIALIPPDEAYVEADARLREATGN